MHILKHSIHFSVVSINNPNNTTLLHYYLQVVNTSRNTYITVYNVFLSRDG